MDSRPHPRPILLIDDSHDDLFLLKRRLARAGVARPMVTIDTYSAAIDYLRSCAQNGGVAVAPVMIFCDVKLPLRTGFDVLAWVRDQPAFRTLPFYMLSGAGLERDREHALELGATDYLCKFPAAEVLATLVAWAEQQA